MTLVHFDAGEEFDLGEPFNGSSVAAPTLQASGQVLRNRLLLHDAVDAEGFETFELDWWPDRLPPAGAQHFVRPIRPAPAATGQK